MEIVIIGSGNIASFFGQKLQMNGHHIRQIISKNKEHAGELGNLLNVPFTDNIDKPDREADLYILAVSDHAIPLLNDSLRLYDAVAAHTAGSVSLQSIQKIAAHTGVMYPLQTIRKGMNVINSLPLLLEGSDDKALKRIQVAGDAISKQQVIVNTEDREKLHLAAVFTNNFTNHLITLVQDYCRKESLPPELLMPLLKETADRLSREEARSIQTGPAFREDFITLEKHRQLLTDYPKMQKVYDLLSENIQQFYTHK